MVDGRLWRLISFGGSSRASAAFWTAYSGSAYRGSNPWAACSVLVGEESGVTPEGVIAVSLRVDQDPPLPTRPWKGLVEGPISGTNAFGAELMITAVRFEGYYDGQVFDATMLHGQVVTPATATRQRRSRQQRRQPLHPTCHLLIRGRLRGG
jgi:hypothetical protein